MQFIIRPPHKEDVLQLSILLKQVYIDTYGVEGVSAEFANYIDQEFSTERLIKNLDSSDINIWVADYKTNLIGALQLEHDRACPIGQFSSSEIKRLYVLRNFSGLGVGRALLEAAETHMSKINQKTSWLWTLSSNQRALDFYTKSGYEKIGKASFQMEVNQYENIVMTKDL